MYVRSARPSRNEVPAVCGADAPYKGPQAPCAASRLSLLPLRGNCADGASMRPLLVQSNHTSRRPFTGFTRQTVFPFAHAVKL